jgi:ribonuclease HI
MHDGLISNSYFPKNTIITCAVTCKKRDALKLINVKKFNNRLQQVGISKFHYEQLAKYHYFKGLPIEEDRFTDTIHQDEGPNAKLIRSFITSSPHQTSLIRKSWNFRNRPHVSFYTDGSLQHLGKPNIKGASAWLEVSNVTPVEYATQVSNEWLSSTKTELIAVLLAIVASPPHSQVDIYLDSKAVIDRFKEIARNVDTFKYPREQLKALYSSLWFMIFVAIESLDLKIILHKVKAHNGNKYNELVDELAKSACMNDDEQRLTINTNGYFKVAPLHCNIEIQGNVRSFIKNVHTANNVVNFVSLKRNKKYSVQRIDWLNTFAIVKGDQPTNTTDFKTSYLTSKRVRLLTEELPTLEFLKATKKEVYDLNWMCPYCGQKEDFRHIWCCSHHIEYMIATADNCKDLLFKALTNIVEGFVPENPHWINIATHGSWWNCIYEPTVITFVDLIKGIIPHDLSREINYITNNQSATKELLFQMYGNIYENTQKLWLDRCKKVISIEKNLSITHKHKHRSSKGTNSYNRSDFVREEDYTHSPIILQSGTSLINKMVTLGCHFSNF